MDEIWEVNEAMSCLITYVSSAISTGRSSKRVFRRATGHVSDCATLAVLACGSYTARASPTSPSCL